MIKLKCEYGKCHLQMDGAPWDVAGDILTALDAIMEALNNAGRPVDAKVIKETIKDWTEGVFDGYTDGE